MYTKEEINENRQKWLAVLRDPESKKVTSILESTGDPNARCCLGHACHALSLKRTMYDKSRYVYYDYEFRQLPLRACEALEIDTNGSFKEPIVIKDHNFYGLTGVNDGTSLTPQEIADVIEDQFKNNNFCYP